MGLVSAEEDSTAVMASAKPQAAATGPREIKKLDEVVVNRIAAGEVCIDVNHFGLCQPLHTMMPPPPPLRINFLIMSIRRSFVYLRCEMFGLC